MSSVSNPTFDKSTNFLSAQKSGNFPKANSDECCKECERLVEGILGLIGIALFAVGIAGLKGRISGLSYGGAVAMTAIGSMSILPLAIVAACLPCICCGVIKAVNES